MKRRKKKKKDFVLPGLGFSPAQKTSSGAGSHGGTARQKRRRERAQTKRDLRNWS